MSLNTWQVRIPPSDVLPLPPAVVHTRCHLIAQSRRRTWQVPQCGAPRLSGNVGRVAAAAAQTQPSVLVLNSQETELVEQLRALLEMSATYDSAKAPPANVASQLGLHVVTTSHQVTAPGNLLTDTFAEDVEDGGGDGMASHLTSPAPARPPPPPPRPPSVLSALRDVNTAAQLGGSSSNGGVSGSSGGLGGMASKLASQWGQSALQQLQARKAFASMRRDLEGSGSPAGNPAGPVGGAGWRQQPEPSMPHFDPLDTLDDDEEGFGIEAALPRAPFNRSVLPNIWRAGGLDSTGLSPDIPNPGRFLGTTASKIASKVGGFSKAAAKKVAASMAEPLAQSVALTSDAAAAVMDSATRAAQRSTQAVAAAAAALPSPVLQAADSFLAAAKSAPGKLRELGGGGLKSSWLAVDAKEGGSASGHPVRIIVVTASPELTRAIGQLHAQPSTSGLVSFESYKLGVKVPRAVYDEASAMYHHHLLPLLMDFLSDNPQGKVCFTGSGAGGSLATVLGLMAASRGLRPYCARPLVCAFDAPPVLAEVIDGALWGCGTTQQDACQLTDWQEMVADAEARGLLAELGLPKDAVLNISTQASSTMPTPPMASIQHPAPAAPTAPSAAPLGGGGSAAMAAATSTAMAASSAVARSISQASAAAARHLSRFSPLGQAANGAAGAVGAAGAAGLSQLVGQGPVAQPGSSATSQPVVLSTMEGDDHMGGEVEGMAEAVHAAAAPGATRAGGKAGTGSSSPAAAGPAAPASSPQLQLFKLVGQVRFQH